MHTSRADTTTASDLATVAGLIARFEPMGLAEYATVVAPPRRALTVLRRALQFLPDAVGEILKHAGVVDGGASATTRVGLAQLMLELARVPDCDEITRWLGAIESHSAEALGCAISDNEAIKFRHDLLDAWFTNVIDSAVEDDDEELDVHIELLRELWVLAVEEGYAALTVSSVTNANRLSWVYFRRPDLTRAHYLALTAARWADAIDLDGEDRLLCEVFVVHTAAELGRYDAAIDYAESRALVARADEVLGVDATATIQLHRALARSLHSLNRTGGAIEHARTALWGCECAYGNDEVLTVDLIGLLGTLLFSSGQPEAALDTARHGEALLRPHALRRTEEYAHACLGLALCLRAVDQIDESIEVAAEAAQRAANQLGPFHDCAIALRELAE